MSRFKSGSLKRKYWGIIRHYQTNIPSTGEFHHITPRSIGGSNRSSNVILVPSSVHYELHKLLVNLCREPKHRKSMVHALWRMSNPQSSNHNRSIVTGEQYARARKLHSVEMSRNNPMHKPEVLSKFIGRKRPEQSSVATRTNNIRWKKRKYALVCSWCGSSNTLVLTEKKRSSLRVDWCCSRSCYAQKTIDNESEETKRKRTKGIVRARKKKLGKPSWNKGLHDPNGAMNGKKSAAKVAQTVTGRRMATRPDGSRYWVYPDSQYAVAA